MTAPAQDLGNIRLVAAFLSKTEVKFDLVSAVDELAAQIKLEFDFEREAKVMDSIAEHLKVRTAARSQSVNHTALDWLYQVL